jgi:hypothetical protein
MTQILTHAYDGVYEIQLSMLIMHFSVQCFYAYRILNALAPNLGFAAI